MRVSVNNGQWIDWAIYLDGARIDYVYAADDVEGWVEAYWPGPMGLQLERRKGRVRILYEGKLGLVR